MLETFIQIIKDLALKAGTLIAGLYTATVISTPTALPVNETPTPIVGASTSAQTTSVATCTVTVNGETKIYTYKSNDGNQTVVCGSQNGQSFSQKVDTGEIMQKIDGQVQNIKDTLKSTLPNLGL